MEGLKSALETAKQVIALSTGVITLTVTFLEKIIQPQAGTARHVPEALKVGWIAFGFAIVFAIWTLMAITGSMNALDRQARKLQLNEHHEAATQSLAEGVNVRVPAALMLVCFAVGIVLVIVSGFYL